jgi:hypothetical protein
MFFFLESPKQSAENEVIVLASLSGGSQRIIRYPGPKIAHPTPHAQLPPDFYVEPDSGFERPGGGILPGIIASEEQLGILRKVRDAATDTQPWGNSCQGEKIDPHRRGHK